MIVVDSSALIAHLTGIPSVPGLDDRVLAERELHAPHLIDLEILNALRKLVRLDAISASHATMLIEDLSDVRLARYRHDGFRHRIWELRDHLSAYDASFVALAETLDATLVTVDARLARAAGHEARIELYG